MCEILPVKLHFFSLRQAGPFWVPPGIRIESIYVYLLMNLTPS